MGKQSYMSRTLRYIEEEWGWINHWRVESYNHFSGRKSDLFNIIDVLVATKFGPVGVQSCGGDFASHRKKIMEEEEYFTKVWLSIPKSQLWLIGWRKMKVKRGGKAVKFYPRVAQIKYKKKTDSLTFTEFDSRE